MWHLRTWFSGRLGRAKVNCFGLGGDIWGLFLKSWIYDSKTTCEKDIFLVVIYLRPWKIVDKVRLSKTQNCLLVFCACFPSVVRVWSICPWTTFASETPNAHLPSLVLHEQHCTALHWMHIAWDSGLVGLILNLSGLHSGFAMCRALEQELSELTGVCMFFQITYFLVTCMTPIKPCKVVRELWRTPITDNITDNDFILKIVQNFSRRERTDLTCCSWWGAGQLHYVTGACGSPSEPCKSELQ